MISLNKKYIPAFCALGLAVSAMSGAAEPLRPAKGETSLHRHIANTMSQTVRSSEKDTLGRFALPKPFSVPCVRGGFQDMFYWDTYFTNAGLLLDGDIWQSRNNIEDVAAMIERFGYMPNATSEGMKNRSQPPLFSMMVKDYYEATADKEFLREMLPVLEKEYNFWMTNRIAPNGLNRYGHNEADRGELEKFFGQVAGRVRIDGSKLSRDERIAKGAHLLAEAESGWDFNPRFDGRCMDFNPVDLNSFLYGMERNQALFLRELGMDGSKEWDGRADKRRKL
ncbi:MAG: alpha,alpha-trehalase, partial [Muribaculaceae bacterium]|nr:alpha,alpha-trehalase [Muribaculaceae bacterium]